MVFLVGGANSASGGYEISNSLRCNGTDSYLNFTLGTPTSQRIATFSAWGKFNGQKSGSHDTSFWSMGDDYGQAMNVVRTKGTPQIYLDDSDGKQISWDNGPNFRDPSAWYHFVVQIDTTQSTDSNRMKWFINGTQLDNSTNSSVGYPTQNYDIPGLASGQTMTISKRASSSSHYIDGYIAEMIYLDGSIAAPTEFGETNDNGVWIPKEPTGLTFGNNGTWLEFKQTGTSANASGIGADTSGNTNHYTVNNLAAIDVTTDTPTNNFATLNPLANYFNPATLSEGNTRVDFANDASTSYIISTIGVASGKWYCEVKGVDIPSYGEIGIASRPRQDDGNDDKLTANQYNYGYTANNGNVKSNSTAGSSYGNSYSDGDMIGIAMDLDNNKLYFSKNGTWQNSGDPTTGSTGTGAFSIAAASTTHDGVYYFAGGSNINNDDTRMDFNFGNAPYSISSGNADANGYGNFEYAVPSGYYSLCTKNLAEYG